MSDETNALINEAKSQARKENIKNFFARNEKLIKRTATGIVIAFAVYGVLCVIQNSREVKYSAILHQSLIDQQMGDREKAKENLKKIYDAKTAPSGVRSLASLRYASMLFDEGKKAEAGEIYAEINDCGSCDSYIQDLSGLLAVKTWMSDKEEVQKADLSERIEDIENSAKTLKYYIAEQRALLEMQRNNLEKSYQIYELIAKNSESSQTLKARARNGLSMIISKGYEPKVEVKSEEKK